jgi:hypothetical protein
MGAASKCAGGVVLAVLVAIGAVSVVVGVAAEPQLTTINTKACRMLTNER